MDKDIDRLGNLLTELFEKYSDKINLNVDERDYKEIKLILERKNKDSDKEKSKKKI